MRYVAALALLMCVGCAARSPRRKVFVFEGLKNNVCVMDDHRSHWDAKRGVFVVVCKPEVNP